MREVFSEELKMNLNGLLADDDLSKDYSVLWDIDSMANVNIIVALEEHYSIDITDAEAEVMRSLRDVIRTVTSKILKNQQQYKMLLTAR